MIPSISLNTSEGMLTTKPIMVKVSQESPSNKNSSEIDDIILTAETSSQRPYKNETFFLTVILKSKVDLANINMPKFSIEEAIVEPYGEPQIERKIIDGVKLNIVSFQYIVTPLNSGAMHIPSITIEGAIPVKRKSQSGSFFDHDFDSPFFMTGFNHLQPFNRSSQPFTLNVQPPIAGITPWLPARHIALEETWDPMQKLELGDPVVRSIKISAEGILSSQLPDLTDTQNNDRFFKVYADKPIMVDEIKEEAIHSSRTEQYTLIPQQSGTVVLPEVVIEWWDVVKNRKASSRIPARTIEIKPKPETTKAIPPSVSPQNEIVSAPMNEASTQRDPLLYVLILGMGILLLAAIGWGLFLQKKLSHISSPQPLIKPKPPIAVKALKTVAKSKPNDKNEKLPDLNPT